MIGMIILVFTFTILVDGMVEAIPLGWQAGTLKKEKKKTEAVSCSQRQHLVSSYYHPVSRQGRQNWPSYWALDPAKIANFFFHFE